MRQCSRPRRSPTTCPRPTYHRLVHGPARVLGAVKPFCPGTGRCPKMTHFWGGVRRACTALQLTTAARWCPRRSIALINNVHGGHSRGGVLGEGRGRESEPLHHGEVRSSFGACSPRRSQDAGSNSVGRCVRSLAALHSRQQCAGKLQPCTCGRGEPRANGRGSMAVMGRSRAPPPRHPPTLAPPGTPARGGPRRRMPANLCANTSATPSHVRA